MIICFYVVYRPTKTIYGVVKGRDLKFCQTEIKKRYPGMPVPDVVEAPFYGEHFCEIHVDYKILGD